MDCTMRREGDHIIVKIPLRDVLSLRVALQPCPCNASKSTATTDIRQRFEKGLARACYAVGSRPKT